MTFGAGMFIKMGIDRVYLYLVMDVDISAEEGLATLYDEVQRAFPDYTIHIVPDVDAAD